MTAETNAPEILIDSSHKYTNVYAIDHANVGGGRTAFTIQDKKGTILAEIVFQNGAIKETGINGVMDENLLAIVINRLEGFQKGPFQCLETSFALGKLHSSLKWLQERTKNRESRGVEGTHKV